VQSDNVAQGPRVVRGSKYLQENEHWSFAEVFLIVGLAVGFATWILFSIVQEWLKGTLTIPILVVVGVLLLIAVRITSRGARRALREYKSYKKGREGEESIAERAIADLDGNWTVFRNFVMPDRTGDIDMILVGPGGVWALEVKTYSASTRLTSSVRRGWRRKPVAASTPDAQAVSNAGHLKELLDRRRCEVPWVQAVLVFAAYVPADFATSRDALQIWGSTEVDYRLLHLRTLNRIPRRQVDRIVAELEAIQASAK
jgi:hypothetical protein